MAPSIAKNTAYLTVASIGQKLVAFAYFLFVARVIGPEHTGAYFLALSITTIFSVIADVGVTPVVIREVAKRPEDAADLIGRALWTKVPFMAVGVLGAIGTAMALGYEPLVVQLVAWASLVMLADAISLLFYGALRGAHALQYESLGVFVGQILTAVTGAIVLVVSPSLFLLVGALIIGSVFNAAFSAWHVAKRLGSRVFRFRWDATALRALMIAALPFALAGVFVKVYSYVDSVFISKYVGTEAVGVYSIAYKLTYAFQFLPMAFVAALYPGMSAVVGKDEKRLGEIFTDAMWYVAVIGVPITFGIWSVAADAVALAGEGYAKAVPVLQWLVFVLIPIFLDFPIGSLLNASNRQATKTAIMGVTMVINVILNAWLVPTYGIVGAAWAALASFSFLFVAGLRYVPQLIPGYHFSHLLRMLAPIVVSGAVMAGFVWFFRPIIGLIPVVVLAVVLYGVLLMASGSVRPEHWAHVQRFYRRFYAPPASHDR